MSAISLEMRPIGCIKANPRNARTHSKKQITQIARSMKEFGNVSPVLIDEQLMLIAGHGRLEAAKSLGHDHIPSIMIAGLSETKKRALMLADNKIAANAGWDRGILKAELEELITLDDFDIGLTGFDAPEIDQILLDMEENSADPADSHPEVQSRSISQTGDMWLLGEHRLLCGDARKADDLALLCGTQRAAMAFLDPPYNVRVADIVGRGQTKHREFSMGSGEMTPEEFQAFLKLTLKNAASVSRDGAVHFVCMDWKHLADLLAAADAVFPQMLNLIAWVKSNGGQGSFYRSQHEMIAVYRCGDEGHLNNIELGKHGRNRTNVWQYAGVNSFGKSRMSDLQAHPTVKPVAMIADAIKDCTKRNDIVLDTFGGSGSTMMACERVGRKARLIEYDPVYVDVAIRRWQEFTGRDAIHAESQITFDEMTESRAHA